MMTSRTRERELKENGLQDAARQFLINHVESQTNKSCLSQRLVTDHPCPSYPDDGDGVLWFVCLLRSSCQLN